MSAHKYVGRSPNSDSSLTTKGYIDSAYGEARVTEEWLDAATASYASSANLVTISYIDAADATRAKKTDVDAADAAYVALSEIGQPGGLVPLDGFAQIPSQYLPDLVAENIPLYVAAQQVHLSEPVTVESTNPKTFKAASVTIADPGYPYQVLPIGIVRGWCPAHTEPPAVAVGGISAMGGQNVTGDSTQLMMTSETGLATVIVDVAVSNSVEVTCTLNGEQLPLIATVANNNNPSNGRVWRYGKDMRFTMLNAELAVSFSGTTTHITALSYFRNTRPSSALGQTDTTFGSGSSLSIGPVIAPERGGIVTAFACGSNSASIGNISGGTQLGSGRFPSVGLALVYSAESATVSASGSNNPWSAISTVLQPIPVGSGRGKMVVLDPSDNLFGGGMTDGDTTPGAFNIVPTAVQFTTPSVLNGNRTLDLWLSVESGSMYTFDSEGFQFGALVLPAQ